jgi:hypothetical protein
VLGLGFEGAGFVVEEEEEEEEERLYLQLVTRERICGLTL